MNIATPPQESAPGPHIERVRHEIRRRMLTVDSVENVTPGMLRIVLKGEELADFVSLGFDDHIKVVVAGEGGENEMRDYTPRRYDNDARALTLDFAIHEAGPVTAWALGAKVGDALQIAGPRGSAIISGEIGRLVLIGDETALPAIGRRIEEAAAGAEIISIGAVAGPEEEQRFETAANHTALWAYRPLSEATDPQSILDVLKTVEITPDTFVWIAAEAGVARALRAWLVNEKGRPLNWIKAAGYWVQGQADAQDKTM
ncbi:siderophore-interacting protein [Escherichia coli]|nr:siderophore-interacting protein [Escherichia coli]